MPSAALARWLEATAEELRLQLLQVEGDLGDWLDDAPHAERDAVARARGPQAIEWIAATATQRTRTEAKLDPPGTVALHYAAYAHLRFAQRLLRAMEPAAERQPSRQLRRQAAELARQAARVRYDPPPNLDYPHALPPPPPGMENMIDLFRQCPQGTPLNQWLKDRDQTGS